MSDTKQVYAAISAVSAALSKEGISKSRKNDQQGFSFRGIDEVLNALAPILAEHKLLVLPRVLGREVIERQTRNGGALFYVTLAVEFDFISAVDGSSHTIKTYGEAMDSGDKATNKAMSAAYKYAAIQAFCIPTEGDHDADKTTHDVAAKAPDGFEDMVADLEIVAGEQGVEALKTAWKGATAKLRKHFTDTNKAGWEQIKAKAVAFDKVKSEAEAKTGHKLERVTA